MKKEENKQIKKLEKIIELIAENALICFGMFAENECSYGRNCVRPCKLYTKYKKQREAKSKT